jgi:hypothetical protein
MLSIPYLNNLNFLDLLKITLRIPSLRRRDEVEPKKPV